MLRRVDNFDLVRQWAAKPANAEFFRRFPPLFTWPADISPWFPEAYFIVVDEQPVGMAIFCNFDHAHKKVEFGFLIDKDSCPHRRPLLASVHKILADYAFNYLEYNKVYSLLLEHRTDVIEFMKSQGAVEEGTLKDNLYWQGKFHNERLVSLFKKDFK